MQKALKEKLAAAEIYSMLDKLVIAWKERENERLARIEAKRTSKMLQSAELIIHNTPSRTESVTLSEDLRGWAINAANKGA